MSLWVDVSWGEGGGIEWFELVYNLQHHINYIRCSFDCKAAIPFLLLAGIQVVALD